LQQKLYRIAVIGLDPTDLSRGNNDCFRLGRLQKVAHGGGVFQIKFLAGSGQNIWIASPVKRAKHCAPDKTAMTGKEYFPKLHQVA
jgi:hypothetical protein